MAKALKDSFLDLERHRQLLEANVEKLRKSLQHWQTLSAEYEGLKEEIVAISSPTRAQLLSLSESYSADLLTKAELSNILGAKSPRSSDQVLNILDRRLDYVQQNVVSAEKMAAAAEERLTAATVVAAPEVRNEEGLPIMEIVEELDEDGEVVSGRVVEPGSARPQLMEVLKKAGVNYPPEETTENASKAEERLAEDPDEKSTEKKFTRKKGVTFAQDTKSGPELETSQTRRKLEEIMNVAKTQDDPIVDPVIPTDESPEDARLRMEMLHYNLPEMGAVVAEMDLKEDGFTDDEEYDEEDGSSFDDEDEYGRSSNSVIDVDMHQRMRDLEEKLGVRMMENVGPKPDIDVVDEGIGRIVIKEEDQEDQEVEQEKQKAQSASKKAVRFAPDLDISYAPPSTPSPSVSRTSEPNPPVADVFERIPSSDTPPTAVAPLIPSSKSSRFKASRNTIPAQTLPFEAPTTSRTVPTGPAGTPLAPTIIERTPASSSITEPDEFDPALLNQEVATEYHKMRNRMVQRQGGFLQDEVGEEGRMELDESEGGPKKQSAFMRARLSKIGK